MSLSPAGASAGRRLTLQPSERAFARRSPLLRWRLRTRDPQLKTLLLILLFATCSSFGDNGDLAISTEDGPKVIKAADAAILQSHWRWLDERYAEASAIKAGSTYADLKKHFHIDGGLHVGGNTFRFVHNFALRLKLDVTFDRELDIQKPDPHLTIKTVSRPYLDQIVID